MQVLDAHVAADGRRIGNLIDICLGILLVEGIEQGGVQLDPVAFHLGDVAMVGDVDVFRLPLLAFVGVTLGITAVPDGFEPGSGSGLSLIHI